MGSGQWMVEKRSGLENDSFLKEHETAPESGCLSIIVLGASGDLAKKKTFPALYNLYRQVIKGKSFCLLIKDTVSCESREVLLIFFLWDVGQGFLHPDEVHIFGYARTRISDDELRDRIRG